VWIERSLCRLNIKKSIKITKDCCSLITIKKRARDHSCFVDRERELLDSLTDLSSVIVSAASARSPSDFEGFSYYDEVHRRESLRLRDSLIASGQIGEVTSLLCVIASNRVCF
jgi:hypothetical protein